MTEIAYSERAVKAQRRQTVKIEAIYAVVFAGLAILLHLFKYPFPLAPWLKFDLAGIPLAVLSLMSIKAGLLSMPMFWVGALLLTEDPTRVIGPSMKILAEFSTAIPLAIVFGKVVNKKRSKVVAFAISFIAALICRVSVMLLMNYLIAPYWMVWAGWAKTLEVAYKLVISVYLPYNAIFNAIIVCYVVPISMAVWNILRRYIYL